MNEKEEARQYAKGMNNAAMITTVDAFKVEIGALQRRMAAQDATLATQQATIEQLSSQVRALFGILGTGSTA